MRRRYGVLAFVSVLALAGAACQPGGAPAEKETLKIAFLGDLTGPNKSLCIGPHQATQLLIEQTNAAGDLPVTLEYSPQDTQGDPTKALPIAKALAADDTVIGVVGPCFSGESESTGPDFEAAGFPRVTPSATRPSLALQGWTGWFRVVSNDDAQSGDTPKVLTNYAKGTKIFIAHDKSSYGEGLATLVNQATRAAGGNVVGFEADDPGKEDYSSLVTKAISAGADVFYWGAYEKEAGLIVKQLRERGFTGKFVGADGSKGTNLLSVGGAAAEGAILTCPCLDPNTSNDPDAVKFVTDYQAEFGAAPEIYAAEGHDATLVIIEAIEKAGDFTDITAYRETVKENVAATSGLKGVTTTISFQANGELAGAPRTWLYLVQGGKFTLVGPIAEVVK